MSLLADLTLGYVNGEHVRLHFSLEFFMRLARTPPP